MKKLIIVLFILISCISENIAGQNRTKSAAQNLSFCGVPMGIPVHEFSDKVCTRQMRDSIAGLVGADECIIFVPNVDLARGKDLQIVANISVEFGSEYGGWVINGKTLLRTLLAAKYGNYEVINENSSTKYIWHLQNGEIVLSISKTSASIKYFDFAAIRKAYSELYKDL